MGAREGAQNMSVAPRFRAWDKDLKRMRKVVRTDWVGDVIQSITVQDKPSHLRLKMFPRDFVLMQWTGRRDQLGNEIWEGDVIEHQLRPDIRWQVCSAYGWARPELNGGHIYEDLNYRREFDDVLIRIGNIYEGGDGFAALTQEEIEQ